MHRRGELDALSSVRISLVSSPFPEASTHTQLSGLPVLRICGSPFSRSILATWYCVALAAAIKRPRLFIHRASLLRPPIPLYTVRNIDSGPSSYRLAECNDCECCRLQMKLQLFEPRRFLISL